MDYPVLIAEDIFGRTTTAIGSYSFFRLTGYEYRHKMVVVFYYYGHVLLNRKTASRITILAYLAVYSYRRTYLSLIHI